MNNNKKIVSFELEEETLAILDEYCKDFKSVKRSKVLRELINGITPILQKEMAVSKMMADEKQAYLSNFRGDIRG